MMDSVSVEARKNMSEQPAINITTLQTLTSKTRIFASDLSGTFHHCAQTRSDIRSALQRELIYQQFANLPLETVLAVDHVHSVFRSTYGLKQWLVAPENGVRNLISECIKLCWHPMKDTADSIRDAVIQAADSTGHGQTSSSSNKKKSITNKNKADKYRDAIIKDAILDGAKAAIQKWHTETLSQLEAVLEAECMRPAPEHFVALKVALLQQLQSPPRTISNSKLTITGQSLALASHPITEDQPQTSPPSRPKEEWSQFYMGWLEKKNRHGVWQRRWVVLSSRQRTAWYFKNPDEVPARAMIKLDDAAIIELPTPPINSRSSMVNGSGSSKNSKGAVRDQHRHSFQLVLSHAPVKRGSNANSKSKSRQQQQKQQQQQPTIITFAADTSAVKRQWMEMLGMAVHGLSVADGQNDDGERAPGNNNDNNTSLSSQIPANKFTIPNLRMQQEQEENGTTMASQEGDGSVVKRKISTKVFPNEEEEEEEKKNEGALSSSSYYSKTSTEGEKTQEEEETEEEKERKAALKAAQEAALIADIEQDAAAAAATEEETIIYQLIITATRTYIKEAHARMADLTGKVVASGMLDRSENELYDDVLEAVLDEHGAAAQALGFLSKV